ncbi:MAG: response regulator transcription factor [Bryobacter sp.]|nr:response regulator transcription factor [Bryobacter sp.]
MMIPTDTIHSATLSSGRRSSDLSKAAGLATAMAPDTEPRTVLLCETQPLTVVGVQALLGGEPNFRFLQHCDNLATCRDVVRRERPHVLILDKALGMQNLLDWITDLKMSDLSACRTPDGRTDNGLWMPGLIIWGVSITEAEALRFLQAGVRGIVRKTSGTENILACLNAVAHGRSWMEDSVFRESARNERYPHSELTPREQQVMELVEHGLKNREIARELGIRPGTVKIHLKHIFEKTGVRGRYGLALTGMREKGILSIPAREGR